MPLFSGKSRATVSKNIREMVHSKTFGKGKTKKKRQQMAIAASYRKAGKSRYQKGSSRYGR